MGDSTDRARLVASRDSSSTGPVYTGKFNRRFSMLLAILSLIFNGEDSGVYLDLLL